jgi:hypothetical protein
MKESYRENPASCSGLGPYAGDGDIAGVASARGNAGQPLSSEISPFVCRSCPVLEKATSSIPFLARDRRTRRSHRPCACADIPSARTGRSHRLPSRLDWERSVNVSDGNADMDAGGKSDDFIVPTKWANKTGTPAAEFAEERKSPKGSNVIVIVVPDSVSDYCGNQHGMAFTARRDSGLDR